MDRFVILSGCSGGGKTTLLAELNWRGYTVVEKPGQRIVREAMSSGGDAVPWKNMEAFLRRAITLAANDYAQARDHGQLWVFFDRGLIDAAAALQAITGEPVLTTIASRYRYHSRVFLVPPWPEIYVQNSERRHSMDAAIAEFERLQDVYPTLGYRVSMLPKACVNARADFVLRTLAEVW
ncbi:ATPase [Candidatus Symbiopectobacterium sp. 'North America']|uniref:AAA family ATPase n=1 Tax=Candidatus Symbiopectobacterium sp. 'North America' TaxID=2794574 RepID=UPI0018CA1242|nr:AAA family ATPase [Candidatus Symbiopectobacterium sp. 'North America']MBG6245966.1 ATPase [Candidatus Symbiopectobacterium sp. 'North America']